MLLTLVAPWPDGWQLLWLILLTLVLFEFIRGQQRISSLRGEIRILNHRRVMLKKREWLMVKDPYVCRYGVLLTLSRCDTKRKTRCWLAVDSMNKQEWRSLCQVLQSQTYQY